MGPQMLGSEEVPVRWSWVVLAGVVAAGVYAFFSGSGEAPAPAAAPRTGAPAQGSVGDLKLTTDEQRREDAAVQLVSTLEGAGAGEGSARDVAWKRLLGELGDTLAARRAAYRRGAEMASAMPSRREMERRITHLDQMRRLLSRGVYLPEMFQPGGADTETRTRLLQVLTDANREVMTWPRGVEGVTRPYVVESGLAPVQIVHRQQVAGGVNAILFWNQGGNLDPRRLRAEQTLLLPLEAVSVHVRQDLHRLGLYIGDWFVKEFRVGVGREETPTPVGRFRIVDRLPNPPWTTRVDGRTMVIPAGDPRNELGAVWMAIESDQWSRTAGFGIHGTIRPETVGSHCSNGCVRLRDEEALEVFDWVRREGGGVAATEVFITYK